MVTDICQIEVALGNGARCRHLPKSSAICRSARHGFAGSATPFVAETFTPENVAVKRRGPALSPMRYWGGWGKTAERDYKKDQPL